MFATKQMDIIHTLCNAGNKLGDCVYFPESKSMREAKN